METDSETGGTHAAPPENTPMSLSSGQPFISGILNITETIYSQAFSVWSKLLLMDDLTTVFRWLMLTVFDSHRGWKQSMYVWPRGPPGYFRGQPARSYCRHIMHYSSRHYLCLLSQITGFQTTAFRSSLNYEIWFFCSFHHLSSVEKYWTSGNW